MRRFLPSASKLELATHCGFAWGTHRPMWPKQTYSKAANKGKASHAVAERVLSNEPADIHAEVVAAGVEGKAETRDAEAVARRVGEYYESIRANTTNWDIERPVAYDVVTRQARYLGANRASREYSKKRENEIAGTLDQAEIHPDRIVLHDLKTGQAAKESGVATSHQMRFYALCLSKIHGHENIEIRYNLADADGVTPDVYQIQPGELAQFEKELCELIEGLPASVPQPGPWCTSMYCPIVSVCPATLKALAEIDIAASPLSPPLNVAIRDAEHAASVRVRLKMVQAATLAVENSLKDWCRVNGPIDLGGGNVYGVRQEQRETLDVSHPGAYQAIVRACGPRVDEAIELDASKASISRVIKDKKKAEELFAELRAMGAMRTTTYDKLTEYKVK